MARTLLVTNDFPPRRGGIQNYLQALADRLPPGELAVYAPAWEGAAAFDATLRYPVHRHPTSLMLPVPTVARTAAALVREHGATTVWFGAAAPLALLGPSLRKAGVERVVASTHGHEVGWSMVPVGRRALRRIGDDADAVTVVSRYTRGRFASAFGPLAALEHVPPAIDPTVFRPDPQARAELRARYGLGEAPVVTCLSRLVARKGQDVLIRALGPLRARVPGARLLIVGDGPDRARLRRLARGVDGVVFTGAVPAAELAAHQAVGDAFALPCRTRGGGLDVEGLGIVLLEAQACGVPVVAGDSGGAPETVRPGETGHVVNGRDVGALVDALADLLTDPDRARKMGDAGRTWMQESWTWPTQVNRLRALLT
ncbi:glycosyltransferase family 4 protein [Pseudonocardia oroxyli]|uniref:Phosphatidylinositol alpha-1,6-mannosyltransferase n=1 Tax=Pseudonocardia oroxyli TaxID=366584 RepID=A0A1G7EQN7_PSEOR|nr:glycosyltransferase family 4 protein [Pseudonocardia oroxyli]SDE65877.1 phosphatidylinositol alpha-1,6-mannosyltransferase [Pseudonocardia oroxyli]